MNDSILNIRDKFFSVVVPVYNSQDSLKELYTRVEKTFHENNLAFEIVFVNDSSNDDSWRVLKEIFAQNPENVSIVQLAKNFGQHNAIFCGLHHVQGDFVITLDDDLQIPPEEIIKLIRRYEETGSDLIYGDLVKKQHSFIRNQGSKVLNKASKKRDADASGRGSSFKMFNRKLIRDVLNHPQNFIYIDEILLWYTKHINFTPVRHEKRKYSKSTYTFKKLFKLFFNISVYYTKAPLKFITYGGLIFSIISFIFGINFIIRKLFFNVPLGYTSMIVAVLFSTSIILFSLGVIGEYLNRMFQVQNKKPPYSVREMYLKKENKKSSNKSANETH